MKAMNTSEAVTALLALPADAVIFYRLRLGDIGVNARVEDGQIIDAFYGHTIYPATGDEITLPGGQKIRVDLG